MEAIKAARVAKDESGGFSVVLAEKVLSLAGKLGLEKGWSKLAFGNPSKRTSSYPTPQRIAAVLAGLACGLRGIGPGNLLLRTNSAIVQRLDGKFPDQGTIHRWLEQVIQEQAGGLRQHLHDVVREHGRFWNVLRSGRRLIVDIDGQGLVARGKRFEEAKYGYLGHGIDRGYQRYVAYVGETREVLDERITPGNTTLMSELSSVLAGLNTIFTPEWRKRVVLRTDSHGGTARNLKETKQAGYGYLTRLSSSGSQKKLLAEKCAAPGVTFRGQDSKGMQHYVECWDLPQWTLHGRGKVCVETRAVLCREMRADHTEHCMTLLTDDTEAAPRQLWDSYHQRGGTIEEYNNQSEDGYHLEIIRTSNLHGLNALHALVGLCWNLLQWAGEELELPPTAAPQAERLRWRSASAFNLRHWMDRASHSGLRLYRATPRDPLEIEDTATTAESAAWQAWLQQPLQRRLRLAG